jgi:hypothetical protein
MFPLQDFFGFANQGMIDEKKRKLQEYYDIIRKEEESDKEAMESLARWGIDW